MKEINYRVHKDVKNRGGSKFEKYCELIIGKKGIWNFLKYELIMLFCSGLPGALGLFLRSKLYPLLLKQCGRNVVFGSRVVLRHPGKIVIGNDVLIDDNCLLDAKGNDNEGIVIKDGAFIGRNSILSCKNGDIHLGEEVNIGFNCEVFSGSRVTIGPKSLIAAYCYFIGGDHDYDQLQETIASQGSASYGIDVGENCWFGAGAKIQDRVSIGANAIIGTGAVVNRDIPEYAIAVGLPARVVKDRRNAAPSS